MVYVFPVKIMSFLFCSLSGLAPTIARADDLSGHKPEDITKIWFGTESLIGYCKSRAYGSRLKNIYNLIKLYLEYLASYLDP